MLQRPIYQTAVALLTLASLAGGLFLLVSPPAAPGVVVSMPSPTPTPTVSVVSTATAEKAARININTASASELAALDGIGSTLAQRIIAYREENGPFVRTDQLLAIERLGPATYEDIRDLVTVGD